MKPGFHIGATYDIGVAEAFAVQPALLFSTKGSALKTDADNDVTVTPYYLELPVNFIYKPVLGAGKLLLGAGPYVAYGLGGKYKGKVEGEDVDSKLEFVNDYKDVSGDEAWVYGKKTDAGVNMLAGYELANNLSFQLNTQLGLMNIYPKDNGEKPDHKRKNIGFGISLGYKF